MLNHVNLMFSKIYMCWIVLDPYFIFAMYLSSWAQSFVYVYVTPCELCLHVCYSYWTLSMYVTPCELCLCMLPLVDFVYVCYSLWTLSMYVTPCELCLCMLSLVNFVYLCYSLWTLSMLSPCELCLCMLPLVNFVYVCYPWELCLCTVKPV